LFFDIKRVERNSTKKEEEKGFDRSHFDHKKANIGVNEFVLKMGV
jgi:hypothetical protein